ENAFSYRHFHFFQSLKGEELRVFLYWCLHCLLWIGARGPYRQVSAISSTVSQLIKMIERHSLSEVKLVSEYLISTSMAVLNQMALYDDSLGRNNTGKFHFA
uniref:AraC family transcriptional regulator n=1 Tax=Mesocestoides corti TaxID=53468 RepID=A0A5K3FUJ5_MESCO